MHLYQQASYYLVRYDSTLGSWQETMLDSLDSPHLVEAMNTIFLKDGILAFTALRSEFGQHLAKLAKFREMTSERSWISFPEHTLLATLGLSLSTSTSESRKLDFYGSPRTLMLAYMLEGNANWSLCDYNIQYQKLVKGARRNGLTTFGHHNGVHPRTESLSLSINADECQACIDDLATSELRCIIDSNWVNDSPLSELSSDHIL